jgi:hypothetical protein
VTYTGFVNGETSAILSGTLAYGGTSQGAVNTGSYLITPSGLSSHNYFIYYIDGVLTINPTLVTTTQTPAVPQPVFDSLVSISALTYNAPLNSGVITNTQLSMADTANSLLSANPTGAGSSDPADSNVTANRSSAQNVGSVAAAIQPAESMPAKPLPMCR